MSEQKAARSKKAKRPDRRPTHQRYTSGRRWIANKLRRLRRHCRRFPNDAEARAAWARVAQAEPVHARGVLDPRHVLNQAEAA